MSHEGENSGVSPVLSDETSGSNTELAELTERLDLLIDISAKHYAVDYFLVTVCFAIFIVYIMLRPLMYFIRR